MTKRYGIPLVATLGGAETLYPEYRKRLQSQYQRPASCGRYCCGWQGGNTGGTLGGGDALAAFAKYVVHPELSEKNGGATQPFQTEETPDEAPS